MNSEHGPHPSLVVKAGGGLLGTSGILPRLGQALSAAAGRRELLVIPGGGPFADTVRTFARLHGLSDSAAHWMAILGMDQYAHALAHHTPGAQVVEDQAGILLALRAGSIPVLAPYRWLRATDELPHRWEVTSDSLAAYLASLLGAEELVLVKPAVSGLDLVDGYFSRALAAGMRWRIVSADTPALAEAILG